MASEATSRKWHTWFYQSQPIATVLNIALSTCVCDSAFKKLQRTEYQANSGVGRCLISHNKRFGGALTQPLPILLLLVLLLVTYWLQDGCCSSKQHKQDHSLQCCGFKRTFFFQGKKLPETLKIHRVSLSRISMPAGQPEKTSIWQWGRDNHGFSSDQLLFTNLWELGVLLLSLSCPLNKLSFYKKQGISCRVGSCGVCHATKPFHETKAKHIRQKQNSSRWIGRTSVPSLPHCPPEVPQNVVWKHHQRNCWP